MDLVVFPSFVHCEFQHSMRHVERKKIIAFFQMRSAAAVPSPTPPSVQHDGNPPLQTEPDQTKPGGWLMAITTY